MTVGPLTPDPSPPSTGERGNRTRFRFLIVNKQIT
jgi:hypothetical protein